MAAIGVAQNALYNRDQLVEAESLFYWEKYYTNHGNHAQLISKQPLTWHCLCPHYNVRCQVIIPV